MGEVNNKNQVSITYLESMKKTKCDEMATDYRGGANLKNVVIKNISEMQRS